MTFITPLPGVETGSIIPFGGGSAPSGYLLYNGAAISRTTYSALFGVVAELYGVGDGSTTFNVPNLVGNVPVGIGASGVTARGDTGGEQTHPLITSEMPAHNHRLGLSADSNNSTPNLATGRNSGSLTGQEYIDDTGGDGAHQNMQPYVGTEYIIKT